MSSWQKASLALVCFAALVGCSTTHPVDYPGLASAPQLTPNPQDKDGHIPFLYAAPGNDWGKYNAVIIDPVVVYKGLDQQFDGTSDANKAVLAQYMQKQFADALKPKFALVSAPGPTTLRVHLTLTGVETSTPVLSTLTKVAPMGLVINSVQTARDKEGLMTGSVSYAVEVYDSGTNRLLRAYVAKQYPWAENIGASFGTLDASRAGIRNGAENLVAQLR